MLISTLLFPLSSFTIRFSLQNQSLVHNSPTLPAATHTPASSLPALYRPKPALPTTPNFYYQPPKKEDFRTLPARVASLRRLALRPYLTRLMGEGLRPIRVSLRDIILAKMKQAMSRQCIQLIRFGFAVRKSSSQVDRVSLIRTPPEGVRGDAMSFTLLISYKGMLLSANQMETSLNYNHLSSHTFTPFLEGTSTSYLSLTYLRQERLSFSRTDESRPLPSCDNRAEFIAGGTYREAKAKGETNPPPSLSSLNGGLPTFSCGGFIALGRICTSSFSSELLSPKLILRESKASSLRINLYSLQRCRQSLKSGSPWGEFEDYVLDPSFCTLLMGNGGGCLGSPQSELELDPRFFLI